MKNRFYQSDKTVMGNDLILFYVTTLATASVLKYYICTNMKCCATGIWKRLFWKNYFLNDKALLACEQSTHST